MDNKFEFYEAESTPKKTRKFGGKQITALVLSFVLICGTVAGGIWAVNAFTITKTGGTQLNAAVTTVPATNAPFATVPSTNAPFATIPFTTPATSHYAPLVNAEPTEVLSAAQIYDRYVGSVVGIITEGTTTNIFGQQSEYAASGTGFVISTDGYIITNCHVVDGGSTFTVSFEDGRSYDGELIGADAANDVALLKIDETGLTPVVIGDSDAIRVGEDIIAIGNPLGELTFSLSKGVVSALNRVVTTDSDEANYMFQIDAAVNSGNSGGPVFNSLGQVIGVVTAKYADTGVEGLGFALPINDVMRIAAELNENGKLRTVSFGITVSDMYYAEDESDADIVGAWVKEVTAGSCAETAGLQTGDIIVRLDSMRITCVNDLLAAKKRFAPDDEATLAVIRDGAELELTIVFDEAEEVPAATEPVLPEPMLPGGWH
ncbi:MAG: trypsin-like serine protease [Ruminococcaceae bacterium]|nr:trypsin-like serine protease [Oscillospiraceae bacterium]